MVGGFHVDMIDVLVKTYSTGLPADGQIAQSFQSTARAGWPSGLSDLTRLGIGLESQRRFAPPPDARMSNFRPTDRQTGFLMPPSADEWLPQRHLARFVVEVIDGLDLKSMSKTYRGSGSA